MDPAGLFTMSSTRLVVIVFALRSLLRAVAGADDGSYHQFDDQLTAAWNDVNHTVAVDPINVVTGT